MKRVFIALMLCIGIHMLAVVSTAASAELSYDFRNSIQDYCRKVADLNGMLEYTENVRSRSQMEMVLFMTDTAELSFEEAPFEALNVVYGPGGFSVLLCDHSDRAVEWLLAQESVIYAEEDAEISACSAEEAETVWFQSWGAEALGFGEYLKYAGQAAGSATVAVIDSGVYSHSLINPKVRAGGYDYIDRDFDPSNDLNGHGTRVAGIVADCTRTLPVYIYPIRVLDANANGKLSNVISAVLEATEAKADIINLSLSSFAQSEILETAIRDAVAAGTVVVAAAGNYSCDASQVTPAKMTDKGVIVVGCAEQDGSRSSFSNYGDSVDVYAYGRNILSCSRNGGYVADSGTSMSAPHVSALSAMIRLIHPGASPENIEMRIRMASFGNIRIPSARAMIPQSFGFVLDSISMSKDAQLVLPYAALPATSMEGIKYESSDPAVAVIDGGTLSTKGSGTAQIKASCRGLEDAVFSVYVSELPGGTVILPQNLKSIAEEAFSGLTAAEVKLPSGTLKIGDRAFDDGMIGLITIPETVNDIGENSFSGAVILCSENSAAHEYARKHDLQYLIQGK